MKIIRKALTLLLALLLIGICTGIAYYVFITHDTHLQTELLQTAAETAAVLDGKGNAIADISLKNANRSIDEKDLPAHVRHAFLAAEDKNFYKHHGLDYKGMARAFIKNLRAHSFRQGASTISQQLVKNTHLTAEKTIRRKLQEIKLAWLLEKNFSKSEILSMYLNTIYFGHACYGIAGAADFYFGKPAQELTPAESATLAAVIRSPNRYSPFVSPDKCRTVRDSVLQQMLRLGFLSEETYRNAVDEPLPKQRQKNDSVECYLDAVFEELETLPIFSPYTAYGGYTVCTYMDADLQQYAEQLQTDADRSGKSLLILDNRSRGILAWYTTEGNLRRQPGSLLKPLAVYAPAIEANLLSPCTPLLDEKCDFGGYSPSNYNDQYAGYISARQALSESRNVPAVRVLNELGIPQSEKALQRLGLTLQEGDRNLSLALGGLTHGFTLPELAGAYAAFANGGQYLPAAFIRKIIDQKGNTVYERKDSASAAFSEDTATLINDILKTAARSGTAKKLASLPFEICGKTGTCGTENGNTDAWAIAYTRDHLFGVWMGNGDNSRTNITGGGLPCHYAGLLAKKTYLRSRSAPFPISKKVVACKLDRVSYEKDHIVRTASPNQPQKYTFTEIFRSCNQPREMTPLFSEPRAHATISYENNRVCIDLCHTEYYAYEIKRLCDGKKIIIYDGFCEKQFIDENLQKGKQYTYFVTPYYYNDEGEKFFGPEETLPSVFLRSPCLPPLHWWQK